MKVAIVGAGFCGLAVAWHFLNQFSHLPNLELTVFDSKGIGGGASGIATGLLHPYAGAHAKLNRRGFEGFEATSELLSIASKALGSSVTINNSGILRLATTAKQQKDYLQSPALLDPNVAWIDEIQCGKMVPGCIQSPGLWIKNGLTVDSAKYLEGLWLACQNMRAKFEKRHFSSLSELKDYSHVVIAAGAGCSSLEGTSHIPLKIVKGQVLELSRPVSLPRLTCAINSHAYIIAKPLNDTFLIGSSYEKNFIDDKPDLNIALQEILPKALLIFPSLNESKAINSYAGLRAVSPTHLPFFKKVNFNSWMLTGMGSKGLLYHALLAKELVQLIYHQK